MNLWIVLFALLVPPSEDPYNAGISESEPMRYRGIEQLLAKFEAEAAAQP